MNQKYLVMAKLLKLLIKRYEIFNSIIPNKTKATIRGPLIFIPSYTWGV